MIKSLLDAEDEPQTLRKKDSAAENLSGDDILELSEKNLNAAEPIPMVEPLPETETKEIYELLEQVETEDADFRTNDDLERKIAEIERRHKMEIEQLLRNNKEMPGKQSEYRTNVEPRVVENIEQNQEVETVVTTTPPTVSENAPPAVDANAAQTPPSSEPKSTEVASESRAETLRQTGMAWSAAIALFGSILFFLIIGWFADLLLDTSPWGLVAGIVIGGILGFVQFFRINAMIFKPPKNEFEATSLKASENAEISENPPANEHFPG